VTEVVTTSRLPVPAHHVWARVTTPAGINDELGPWLHMTVPHRARGTTLEEVDLGIPLGRSWLLALGVVPVEWDDLRLIERGPGYRFLERSSTLTARRWEHERTVISVPNGCEVRDRVAVELRRPLAVLPASSRLAHAIVRQLFAHRHRRLRTAFAHC
jgi:ligand-binding SRPBCC domain-containing protein